MKKSAHAKTYGVIKQCSLCYLMFIFRIVFGCCCCCFFSFLCVCVCLLLVLYFQESSSIIIIFFVFVYTSFQCIYSFISFSICCLLTYNHFSKLPKIILCVCVIRKTQANEKCETNNNNGKKIMSILHYVIHIKWMMVWLIRRNVASLFVCFYHSISISHSLFISLMNSCYDFIDIHTFSTLKYHLWYPKKTFYRMKFRRQWVWERIYLLNTQPCQLVIQFFFYVLMMKIFFLGSVVINKK